MLMWIAVVLALLVPAAALAGPLEDCEQERDNDRRIWGCTERLRKFPRDAVSYVNRGKAYLKTGDLDRAMDLLELRSVMPGIANREWVEHDSDLDSLRDHPRFQALLGQL